MEIDIWNAKIKFNGLFGLLYDNNAKLYIWGQLDTGSKDKDNQVYKIPKQIPIEKQVKSFSCGWQHAIVLTTDNMLYGMGSNKFSELGCEQKIIHQQLIQLQPITEVINKVVCGFRQSYLIYQEGILVCGQNKSQELGLVEPKVVEQFMKLALPNIVKLKCGQKFTIALSSKRTLYGWGCNKYGQLTQGGQQVVGICELGNNILKFDCGWSHHIVLRDDGVFITGRGDFGQQGNGNKEHNYTYKQIMLYNVVNVKCGSESSYLLCEDGLYVSGWNEHGNLGIGHNNNIYTFTKQETVNKLKCRGAVAYRRIDC